MFVPHMHLLDAHAVVAAERLLLVALGARVVADSERSRARLLERVPAHHSFEFETEEKAPNSKSNSQAVVGAAHGAGTRDHGVEVGRRGALALARAVLLVLAALERPS